MFDSPHLHIIAYISSSCYTMFMDNSTYLHDPCGASSLPFWKANSISIPDYLLILREGDPRLDSIGLGYKDTPYFKLIHHMQGIEAPTMPEGFRFICPTEKELSVHIAACYDAERVSEAELQSYRYHPTFSPDLWLAVLNESTGEIVASGVAEVDRDIREGVLEWIQVSPAYRRRGLGRIIVHELLFRMNDRADFVTVSGKSNDPSDPLALYESCGFGGEVVWHILRRA